MHTTWCRTSKWELHITKSARKEHFHSSIGWWFANNVVKYKGPSFARSNDWWHKEGSHEDQDRLQKLWCCCHLRFSSGSTTVVWKRCIKIAVEVEKGIRGSLVPEERRQCKKLVSSWAAPSWHLFQHIFQEQLNKVFSAHTMPQGQFRPSQCPHQHGHKPPCLVLTAVLLQPSAEMELRPDPAKTKRVLDCI